MWRKLSAYDVTLSRTSQIYFEFQYQQQKKNADRSSTSLNKTKRPTIYQVKRKAQLSHYWAFHALQPIVEILQTRLPSANVSLLADCENAQVTHNDFIRLQHRRQRRESDQLSTTYWPLAYVVFPNVCTSRRRHFTIAVHAQYTERKLLHNTSFGTQAVM
jgi:hypothetical protein